MNAAAESAAPIIDIGALFGAAAAARDRVDAAVAAAAADVGFISIVGLPSDTPLGRTARAELLRIFALPPAVLRTLWRRKFEPCNRNVYRGWFPLQPGNVTSKEGIDLGGDIAHGAALVDARDPLRECTPLPTETELPGWRAAAAAYYLAMERICRALLQSIARSLQLPQDFFDGSFHHGLSTLRLLHYPTRTAEELASCTTADVWVVHQGKRRYLTGAEHTDSGFVTLLAQDGTPGLQARTREGRWIDVLPHEGALVVNFGQILQRWSGGRIRATAHRVLGAEQERFSIPFFYEARADAEIRPLPGDDPASFTPFLYGDYLWARIVEFVEFRGMQAERSPLRG